MKYEQPMTTKIFRKSEKNHPLDPLSDDEVAERVARRRGLIFQSLVTACIVVIGLQFVN